jgi:two-component system response regulator RegX3
MLLPDTTGIEVCRRMRELAPVPVVIVSAAVGEADIVLALELGAADYITKPYHLRELVARIQAVLRRLAPTPELVAREPAPPTFASYATGWVADHDPDVVVAGPVLLDRARRTVEVDGYLVHLSRREFDLLDLLLSPPGQVRTRDELIDRLWSDRHLADSRTIDTHVLRLRSKIEPNPGDPRYLVTVRGVGFRFDPEG